MPRITLIFFTILEFMGYPANFNFIYIFYVLQVSGSFITSRAEINIGIPIITIGNGDQILAKGPIYGTIRLKTLEIVEAEPTA